MPNKKNKNSRYTGFYWYMQELLPGLKKEGRIHGGIDQVVPVARPMWKALSKQEQDRYDKIAKEMKRKDSNNMFGLPNYRDDSQRLDNVGNIIAHRTDQNELDLEQRTKARRFTKTKWPEFEEIVNFPFYFIGFEYLCQLDESKEYIPIEVSLMKWNMQEGIMDTFHKFINPGPIPVGYRYTCQHHSDETHQIPLEDFDQADSNYLEIWGAMENFINPRGDARDSPPVYCALSNWHPTISMIEWLYLNAHVGRRNLLQNVFVLEDCVQDLTELAGKSISPGSATSLLQTSVFDYDSNTRCPWHEEREVRDCALGTVKRYAYALAGYFSGADLYGFEVLPGSHLPARDSSLPSHTTIQPDRVYMEPQSVNTGTRNAYSALKGAAAAQNNDTFASRDIRYKKHDKVEINLDGDSEDDDIESQYSYSTKMAASSYSDADRPKSAWSSYMTQSEKPNIKDIDDFPSLGGEGSGSKFAARAAPPPPNLLPQPSFSAGDTPQTTWKPSAAYLEEKRLKEQQLSKLPSLEAKVSHLEMNNNSKSNSVSDPWSDAASKPEKARAVNSNNWAPKTSNTAARGRGASMPLGRGRGVMNFGSNPWSAGATRGDPGKAPPSIAMGRGRGRGSWVPMAAGAAEPDVGVRPPSPTESMTSQASTASTASSVRPPPGFGRGMRSPLNM